MFLISRRANQANDAELKHGPPSRFLFKKNEEKQIKQGKPAKVAIWHAKRDVHAKRFSNPNMHIAEICLRVLKAVVSSLRGQQV